MGGPPQKRPRNLEISELCPKEASPQRSDGHLGEAEAVDQTFLRNSLSAFWILGILEDGYSISHFEKADTVSHQGVFAFVKKQVAHLLTEKGTTHVNLELDLGIPGLRRSKSSYAPHKHLRKYVVRLL